MKHHTKSLFFSILIHSSILAILFYIYSTITPRIFPPKEKRICINLGTIKKESKRSEVKSAKRAVVAKEKPKPKKHFIKKKELYKKEKSVVKKKKLHKVPKKPLHKTIEKKVKSTKKIKKVHKPTLLAIPPKEMKKEETAQSVKETPQKLPQVQKCQSKEKIYIEQNINKIASLIKENLYYPRRARKRGIEGIVVVKFFLHKDGKVSDTHIVSSQSAILGRAALKTINQLSGEFPKPVEELTLTVPINYELR